MNPIKNARMLRDVVKLERQAKNLGKIFEQKHGRKPTQEEAEAIARNLAEEFSEKYGFAPAST